MKEGPVNSSDGIVHVGCSMLPHKLTESEGKSFKYLRLKTSTGA
jgi:hypothetical protein